MVDVGVTRESWSARYEQLRADWFSHQIGWGQSLFVRQGMMVWMQAWSATPSAPASVTALESHVAGVACQPAAFPPPTTPLPTTNGVERRELTHALANLILHRRGEVLV